MKKLLSNMLVLALTLGCCTPCLAYTTGESGQSQGTAFGGNSSEPKTVKIQEKNACVKNNFNPYKVKIKKFFRKCKNKIKDIANYKYVKEILIGSAMLFSGYKVGRNLGYDSAKKEFEPIIDDKNIKLKKAAEIIKNQGDLLNNAARALSICKEKCQKRASTDSSNDFNSPLNNFTYDNTDATNFLSKIDIKSDPMESVLAEMNNFADKLYALVDKFCDALNNVRIAIFIAGPPPQNNENLELNALPDR